MHLIVKNSVHSILIVLLLYCYMKSGIRGSIAQPGERPPHTREVTGSSPVAPTILNSVFMAIVNVIDTLLFYPGVCTKTSVLMYNKITAR